MVNNLIVQGIKMAVERGSSLQDAMISFYNAGYKKEEVEDAARAYQAGGSYSSQPQAKKPQVQSTNPMQIQQPKVQSINPMQAQQPQSQSTNPMQIQQPKVQLPKTYPKQIQQSQPVQTRQPGLLELEKQKPMANQPLQKQKRKTSGVSDYGVQDVKSKRRVAVVFLLILLVLLIFGLTMLFLFKDSIISFFNSSF